MFKNQQLNQLLDKYRENKLAHAYLIETNDINSALEDLKNFIKQLICPKEYSESCSKCNLCNLINKNNLPSLKIIEPDGTYIKKNQIEELKQAFATIPIYSKYNIYIIKNAEKLNSSSANTMLKFLEEPTDGIIGFFITNNKDVMIDTIKSRCASLHLFYESRSIQEKLNLTEEVYQNYLLDSINFLKEIENKSYLNNKKGILAKYPERKEIETILKIIHEIFYQKLKKQTNQSYDQELILNYPQDIPLQLLIKKLNILTGILQDMSYNVNIELILDRFVLEMRGTNE